MTHDELDRVLSRSLSEEEIVPSSGFTASVMEAVRREATEPPPIPFPWRRALPGVAAAGLTLVWLFVEIILQAPKGAAAPPPSAGWVQPVLHAVANLDAGWLALAAVLVVSFASVLLSVRLTSGTFLWQRNR
jgi:hypothetical protein